MPTPIRKSGTPPCLLPGAMALIWFWLGATLAVGQVGKEPAVRLKPISIHQWSADTSAQKAYLLQAMGADPAFFSLRASGFSENLLGRHLRYTLLLHGVPVLDGSAVLTLFHHEGTAPVLTFPELNTAKPETIVPLPANRGASYASWYYADLEGKWQPIRAESHSALRPEMESYTNYYDLENRLLFTQDWLRYFQAGPDSLVKATVFRPDPSSRLQIPYGSALRDRSDSNSVTLTQALDTVQIRVLFSQDTFRLRNSRFTFGEFSEPVKPLARQTQADFCFTRDSVFFEEVNAWYHLNRIRQYVDSLGFSNYADYSLRVDAHGMNGADQSAYSPVLDVLAFGEGGVDDAEDATVVVHEYIHVLANDANPLSNSGAERKALEEGICDYVAGSYCKKQSAWNWEKIYKWDGHNEFWNGRTVMSSKHYPNDLVNQPHQDGEIWSSAMMNIELQIGREKTHKLLFSIFPMLAPNLKFSQAAYLILKADTVLFGGANGASITPIFENAGIGPGPIIVSDLPSFPEKQERLHAFFGTENQLILHNLPQGEAYISVCDLTGKVVFRQAKAVGPTAQKICFQPDNASVFVVLVTGAHGVISQKVAAP